LMHLFELLLLLLVKLQNHTQDTYSMFFLIIYPLFGIHII
jgi:hypothetical protein